MALTEIILLGYIINISSYIMIVFVALFVGVYKATSNDVKYHMNIMIINEKLSNVTFLKNQLRKHKPFFFFGKDIAYIFPYASVITISSMLIQIYKYGSLGAVAKELDEKIEFMENELKIIDLKKDK
jgi:hypothetical protein